jgi:hypothetical protein
VSCRLLCALCCKYVPRHIRLRVRFRGAQTLGLIQENVIIIMFRNNSDEVRRSTEFIQQSREIVVLR